MKTKNILILFIALLVALLSAQFVYAESTFSASNISEALVVYVRSQVIDDCEVEVLGTIPDKKFNSDDVVAEFLLSEQPLHGLCSVVLKFNENGRVVDMVNLRVRVKIYADVPVAIRTLSIGDYLYGAVEYRRMEITKYNEDEIANDISIKTCVARKEIKKGSVVLKNVLTQGMVIKRGQQVDIVVVSGGVQVYSSGQAITDAAAGEQCRVKRDNSKSNQGIMTGWAGSDGKVYVKAK